MSDNLKYYYIKVKENYYDSDEMILLESMQDGYIYSNILMKLHLRSLKNDGKLMLNNKIPYNDSMLASITRHTIGNIRQALEIFAQLGLIEQLQNGAIYMNHIQNMIGRSSTEADRKREYRAKIDDEKKSLKSPKNRNSKQLKGQMSDKNPPEIELELEKQKKITFLQDEDEEQEKWKKLNTHMLNNQMYKDKKYFEKLEEIKI